MPGLSTKLYTLKTNVFEMSGELTSLKSGLESLNTEVRSVEENMAVLAEDVRSSEKEDVTIKSELGALKSGLSGLSNSILTVKSRISSLDSVEGRVRELDRNLTGVRDDMSTTQTQLAQITPEVSLIATDISALRAGISRMSVTVSSMADPPRFSCGVTGEEVKVSGVIAYDECAVNTEKMMNLGTGHATVPVSGDYLLTFSANMVSLLHCRLQAEITSDTMIAEISLVGGILSEQSLWHNRAGVSNIMMPPLIYSICPAISLS